MPVKPPKRSRLLMITLETVLTVALVALVVALVAWVRAAASARQLRELKTTVASMERFVALNAEVYQGLSAGALGQGQNLARLRQDLSQLKDRIEQIANSDTSGSSSSFNKAIRLARGGRDSDELMETCGLSRVEADLIVMLHRGDNGQPLDSA